MWQIFLRKYYYCQFFRSVSLFGTCPNLLCNRERERKKSEDARNLLFLGSPQSFFFFSPIWNGLFEETQKEIQEKRSTSFFFSGKGTHIRIYGRTYGKCSFFLGLLSPVVVARFTGAGTHFTRKHFLFK